MGKGWLGHEETSKEGRFVGLYPTNANGTFEISFFL
jgi:hypothetical protein